MTRVLEIDLDRIPFDKGLEFIDKIGKKGPDGQDLMSLKEQMDFVLLTLPPDLEPPLGFAEGLKAIPQVVKTLKGLLGEEDADDIKA